MYIYIFKIIFLVSIWILFAFSFFFNEAVFNWYPLVSGYGCISSLRSNILSTSFGSTVGEQRVFPGQVGQLIPPACCGSVQGFPLSWTQEHGQGISWPYGVKPERLWLTVLIELHCHVYKVALTAPIMGADVRLCITFVWNSIRAALEVTKVKSQRRT